VAGEFAALAACIGLAVLLVFTLTGTAGMRALEMLPFDIGAVAAALMVTAAWTGSSHRTRLVAGAVAAYTAVPLLLRGAGLDPAQPFWLLAGAVAVLGSVGLLALALRPRRPRHDRLPQLLVGVVVLMVVVVLVLRFVAPEAVPPSWLVDAVGMLAWSGAAAMSLLMIVAGVRRHRPLLRRVGLAFAVLTAARAIALLAGAPAGTAQGPVAQALELGAMAMLLVAGVRHLVVAIRRVQQHVAVADAVLAAAARDDDAQAVVVLPGQSRAEDADVSVTPLLRDLAILHRSSGLAVDLDVEPGLHVVMDHWALGQAVTNLLLNCERHAPGAHVWLRARRAGRRARLEVVDDGPGLPDGTAPAALRGGTNGLAVTADIVGRYGGTFTLTSHDAGTTAVLDLPAYRPAPARLPT
jgi:two-component system, OmpR family, sensor kinase